MDVVRTNETGSGGGGGTAHRVVWQVAEGTPSMHEALLRQVANLLTDLGADGVRVEVVAHGPGLDLLLADGAAAGTVRGLQNRGVAFLACENSMRSRSLDRTGLVEGARTTPSGVGHVVRRQTEGWSYLRA